MVMRISSRSVTSGLSAFVRSGLPALQPRAGSEAATTWDGALAFQPSFGRKREAIGQGR